jgi:hypothetical protein
MKKFIMILSILIVSFSLFSLSLGSEAIVKLNGAVSVKDIVIDMYYENGFKQDDAIGALSFVFPSTNTWEVEQSVYFKYSSNLASVANGTLSFSITSLEKNNQNILKTDLKLSSDNSSVLVRDGNTLDITFPTGLKEDVDLATLTVVITKTSTDVYATGIYTGLITLSYVSQV